MKTRVLALLAAALLAVGMIAGPGIAWYSDTDTDTADTTTTDSGGEPTELAPNEAEITLADCVVESSKDISYVAYEQDGSEVDRNESIDAESFDLSEVDGIEDITSVTVKAGQTVTTLAVDCPVEDDDTTDDHGDDSDDTDSDDTDSDEDADDTDDDTTGDDDDDDVTEPDTVESHNDKANANSQAVITLSGCTVNSSKAISSVTFLDGGSQLDKDDSVGSQSYDLNSFGDIDEVDAIRVKAGTTVATFSVNCGTDDGTTDDTEDADHHGDDDADHHDDAADRHGDGTEDDGTEDDDATSDDDVTKDEDSDDTVDDDSTENTEDDTDTDAEWDARHDGRHEHKDHQEVH